MMDKLYCIGERSIKYIALIPLVLVTLLVFLYRTTITMDIIEASTVLENGFGFVLMVLLGIVCLTVSYFVIKRIPESVLFAICTIGYLFMGIYLITHIQMELRYDSGICYWNAMYFVKGEFLNLQQGEYFYKNPHQLGLVAYDCLLLMLSDKPNFVYYVNLFWIIIGNFFMWRTVALVCKERPMVRKLTILFSFLFVPQFLYLFFAYGQVPGLGCLLIAIYFFVRSIEKESKCTAFAGCVFMGLACLLRMNYVIAAIAISITLFLHFLKSKQKKYLIAIVVMIVCIALPRMLVNGYFEKVADTDLNNGMPSTLYIAMGLQENEEPWRANGWYNGFNDSTYLGNEANAEVANEIAKEAIKERLNIFAKDPKYAFLFFKEKVITTWCEPTFQSVWSGPLICMGCATEEPWLIDLYSGGGLFIKLSVAMNVFNFIAFAFATWYVLRNILFEKKAIDYFSFIGILFFLGGFLFHFFWETKSQYVYPYVVCLLPVAAYGVCVVWEDIKNKIFKNKKAIPRNEESNSNSDGVDV